MPLTRVSYIGFTVCYTNLSWLTPGSLCCVVTIRGRETVRRRDFSMTKTKKSWCRISVSTREQFPAFYSLCSFSKSEPVRGKKILKRYHIGVSPKQLRKLLLLISLFYDIILLQTEVL